MDSHTQLWKPLDARHPTKGYGAVAVGKVWSWYETWLTRVREECQQHPDRYRTALAAAAQKTDSGGDKSQPAWASIVNDTRFMQQQLTQGQAADAQEKARNNKEGARRAIRAAWSHVLYAVKTPDTEPGKAFDLEHLGLSAKDRNAIPAGVYDKAKADDIVKERLGAESLWLKLKDLWPAETPHLAISEVAEWFSAHAYMPKLRDRVVLETSIREAIGKFDAPFGYAEGFDQAAGRYAGLIFAKAAPEILAPHGLLVRADAAKQQTSFAPVPSPGPAPGAGGPTPPTSPPPVRPARRLSSRRRPSRTGSTVRSRST